VVTLVMTAVPKGLRGDLSKWLLELKPGVFAGNVTTRVRDYLWARVKRALVKEPGSALMLITDHSREQGYQVRACGEDRWVPADFDGLTLMGRPCAEAGRVTAGG
jgi:CRISPR-associated protein Cas2